MHKVLNIDMDGVFCDFVGGFVELAKRVCPELIPHLPDLATQEKFYIDECISDPVMAKKAEELCNHPELFGMLPPYAGAIEGMQYLRSHARKNGLEVMICTAPHKENKESYSSKAVWIETHLGFDWLNQTLIVRDKTVISGIILLDDKPQPLGKFRPTWEHVLMDQPYNRSLTNKPRMKGWTKEGVESLVDYALQRYERYSFGMTSRGLVA